MSRILGYGVMVTLQILVLPFLVRVRVAQQQRDAFASLFFCVVFLDNFGALNNCFFEDEQAFGAFSFVLS